MIFCRSKRAAERALERLKPYIEGKLFLKLNEQKTKICRVTDSELKFLGFGFWRFRTEAKVRARPHQKSKAKCRLRLRAITSRSRGQSLDAFRRELRAFVRGWVNYFRISVMSRFVKETDKWLRRRIRLQNPAFSAEDSKVSVATCTATTQMASIFRICGTAGSSPAIFMSKEGTKPRQVESADLSTG